MIPAYQLLARRIRTEINELERTVRRAERAWQGARGIQTDQELLRLRNHLTNAAERRDDRRPRSGPVAVPLPARLPGCRVE